MAVLGLRFCARAFPSRGKRGPLFIAVRGPLTIVASLVAEHRLQMRRLSNCGSRAQPLRGMWDPPRPGLEPVSPALAGGFSTTAPPGKPPPAVFKETLWLRFGELDPVFWCPVDLVSEKRNPGGRDSGRAHCTVFLRDTSFLCLNFKVTKVRIQG